MLQLSRFCILYLVLLSPMICLGQQSDSTSKVHEVGVTPLGFMGLQLVADYPSAYIPMGFRPAHSLFYKIRKNDHTLRFGASYLYSEIKGNFTLDTCQRCYETRGFNHYAALWTGMQAPWIKHPQSTSVSPYYGADIGLFMNKFAGKFTYSESSGEAVTSENMAGVFFSPFVGIKFDIGSRLTLSTEINAFLNLGFTWNKLSGNGVTEDRKEQILKSSPRLINFTNLLNISYRFRRG